MEQIKKILPPYSLQVIGIVITLTIGGLIGLKIGESRTGSKLDKEMEDLVIQHKLELEKEYRLSRQRIDSLTKISLEKDRKIEADGLKIEKMNKEVLSTKREVQRLRSEARKLSTNEKIDWINSRYDSLPK